MPTPPEADAGPRAGADPDPRTPDPVVPSWRSRPRDAGLRRRRWRTVDKTAPKIVVTSPAARTYKAGQTLKVKIVLHGRLRLRAMDGHRPPQWRQAHAVKQGANCACRARAATSCA